ncbi:undecaprenyl-phosphate 4-deoxy-4-formamido-L-arabinose transferase [Acrasis kona]|uniref:Undecaprenyl-phosphate 4-deoxy-4-formamido-L-arabinose transferase n=1 Tax=Acrasis kona TaxID=1008807 RepID=A0AAW2ZJJ0_9EUKA
MNIILLVVCLCSIVAIYCGEPNVKFNINNTYSHPYLGFGATVWQDERENCIKPALKELNMKYVRWWVDYQHDYAPFDNFDYEWSKYSLDRPKAFYDLCKQNNVTILMIMKRPAMNWLKDKMVMKEELYGAWAKYWAAAVDRFMKNGIEISYVEVFNEQDGDWDAHVDPKGYAKVVEYVRKELDYRNYQKVGIVGPGTSHVDELEYLKWVNPDRLVAWSNHAYEFTGEVNQYDGHKWMRSRAQRLASNMSQRKDLPILITELGSKTEVFHNIRYNPFNRGGAPAYASRLAHNALELISSGIHGLFIWDACDHEWDKEKWGMIAEDGTKKVSFWVMKQLISAIPAGSKILKPSNQNSDVATSAYYDQRGGYVFLSHSNAAPEARKVEVFLENVKFSSQSPVETLAWSLYGKEEEIKKSVWVSSDKNWVAVDLPSDSLVTLKFKL